MACEHVTGVVWGIDGRMNDVEANTTAWGRSRWSRGGAWRPSGEWSRDETRNQIQGGPFAYEISWRGPYR